ncbi:nuclear transport factor 2 family protein [Kitasatospora griseola]|uniref:nuclear transport factor 2 family protein n=1 Tax=Kitasatospora griseola TaxID=2064 RepID=UPI003441B1F7
MTDLFSPVAPSSSSVDPQLYIAIQQFYARHMQAVDGGDARTWALGFTEDGEFDSNALPAPVRGRETIETATLAAEEARRPTGVTRRHVMTMLAVEPEDEAATVVRTRSYVAVFTTLPGQPTGIYCMTSCQDVLVRQPDGGWRIRSRHVLRDDLPPRD